MCVYFTLLGLHSALLCHDFPLLLICGTGIKYLWSIGNELVVRGSAVHKTGIVSVQFLTMEFTLRSHCEPLCTSLENGLKI